MKKVLIAIFAGIFFTSGVHASEKILLADCEAAALKYSHSIKALENEVKAAKEAAESVKTNNYPSLVLEGSLKYIAEVPKLNGTEFGDNWNYSLGPAVYWTAFDGNVRNKNYKSLLKAAEAKELELEYQKKETLLNVRTEYFRLISSLTTLELLNRQLELSLSQNRDVKESIRSGIKTNLDGVLSDSEVLSKQNQIKSAQLAVTESLRKLNEMTGDFISFDFKNNINKNSWEEAFIYDSPEQVLESFKTLKNSEFDFNNPAISSLEALARYYDLLAQATINSNYPVINLFAKTSADRPNGPVSETFNQNSAGASFSMPIYQFGKNKKASAEKQYTAQAYEERRQEMLENLLRLFNYSRNKLEILAAQKDISIKTVAHTKKAAELMYSSYKAGESKFLDVEAMNVKVLEAQSNEININTEMLMQIAIIASLAK